MRYNDSEGVKMVFKEACKERFTLTRKAATINEELSTFGDIKRQV